LPVGEVINGNSRQSLNCLHIDWFPSIEINLVDTFETHVADGFGGGLCVSIPKTKMSLKVRSPALKGLAPVVLGALWREKAIAARADVAGRITGQGAAIRSLDTGAKGGGNADGKGVAAWKR
jgi:hypothetical protein